MIQNRLLSNAHPDNTEKETNTVDYISGPLFGAAGLLVSVICSLFNTLVCSHSYESLKARGVAEGADRYMSSEAGHNPAQTPLRLLNPSKNPPPVTQQPRCQARHKRVQIAVVESCVPCLDGSNQTVEYDIHFCPSLHCI